ncbi:acetyl esterase/lipase [Murinocardiopsis flavida]|uniref:Acetyl esterase/lipase n=1 Tax=Murinocardiopsis flavida TaxID=645275 RepID=A0A2P8CRB0_9ACTN|nr:alpha/beta hydrolase [Murinocardiopsis flavida]PSK87490.1 acetyl esterase/lipase [Murinocardiopsis flavida]
MTSIRSRAWRAAASVVGRRIEYRDPVVVRRKVERARVRPDPHGPPRRLDRTCAVRIDFRHGWPCYEVRPRSGPPAVNVVFLHGGAYIDQVSGMHWRLAETLVHTLRARVAVPVYPLVPEGTAARVVPEVAALVRESVDRDAGSTVLMGDSAGGGLAVAVAQRLRDESGYRPARLVLISPWLDVTMDHPDIPAVEPLDPELSRAGLRLAGRLWAGGLDPADPLASPINGDLAGLPPATVFIGTRDILNPDAHRFRDRAEEAGVPVEFHEAAGQIHVYPLYPLPEGRRARAHIIARLE